MNLKGLKQCVAGLMFLAGGGGAGLAQTTTPAPVAPATQTPAVAPATQTPAVAPATQTPPVAPAAQPAPSSPGTATTPPAAPTPGKTTDQIPPTEDSATPGAASPAPDQSSGAATSAPDAGAAQPAAPGVDTEQPDAGNADGADAPDELSIGEIPEIKIVDLTPEKAKAAVDTYGLLKDKYKDAKLEDYETLQDFVDKDPVGKAFEADVKAAGFADVEIWNQTITTVSTTYSNMVNDQTADTLAQIAEVEKDTELATDMKDKLLASLRALIPTDNNRKVVQTLMDDPNYKDKLTQLESEEE